MRPLRYSINVTLDGCCHHEAGLPPDEESMRYWLGLMLWIQASLGKETLREVIDSASGTSPSDFLYALKVVLQQQATAGAIHLAVGGLDVEKSRLSTEPAQGALGWREVTLSPGDSVRLAAYIPGGIWQTQMAPHTSGLEVTFDGRGPLPVDSATGLSLGAVNEGWHTIEVSNRDGTVQLHTIELELTDTL